jgi:hypothetical protein
MQTVLNALVEKQRMSMFDTASSTRAIATFHLEGSMAFHLILAYRFKVF